MAAGCLVNIANGNAVRSRDPTAEDTHLNGIRHIHKVSTQNAPNGAYDDVTGSCSDNGDVTGRSADDDDDDFVVTCRSTDFCNIAQTTNTTCQAPQTNEVNVSTTDSMEAESADSLTRSAAEQTKVCNGTSHRDPSNPNNNNTLQVANIAPAALTVCNGGKFGDVEREKEIERRMRELGLWDYKSHQERHVADMLDNEIVSRDGLCATLKRCRRRQRGASCTSPAEEIRNIIEHNIVRDIWGEKMVYEVKVLMGSFTKDVAHMTSHNVVTVRGVTSGSDVRLTKEISVELPTSVDELRVVVTYMAGVVKISAPYTRYTDTCRPRRNTVRHKSVSPSVTTAPVCPAAAAATDSRPLYRSVSSIYSLQKQLENIQKT